MDVQQNTLDYISKMLMSTNKTVSCAEGVTSGLLQFSFSQMENALDFFKGGITAYTKEEKMKFLDINPIEADKYDCVSENIAKIMALNVAKLFNTDWSIAITGYCHPVKESAQKLYAYYCIAFQKQILVCKKLELLPTTNPEEAQMYYNKFLLGCFKNQLNQHAIFNSVS